MTPTPHPAADPVCLAGGACLLLAIALTATGGPWGAVTALGLSGLVVGVSGLMLLYAGRP
jgi:hypothetical protein